MKANITDTNQARNKKTVFLYGMFFILLGIFCAISLSYGSIDISFREIIGSLLSTIGIDDFKIDAYKQYVIVESRLPRIVLSVLIGSTLAITGVAMQGLFRNPLASPGILGINSAAAIGAAIMIVLGNNIFASFEQLQVYAIPLGAFIAALIITILIVRVGTVKGKTNVVILLLSGVAFQAILGAVMGLLIYISNNEELRTLSFWTMGDLDIASWQELIFITPIIIVCSWMILRKANALNLLLLGEAEAHHLGIDVQKLKQSLIIWTSLSVALAVSFTGIIAFIGLVAPHLARLIFGANHKRLFLGAMLIGACLLTLADFISRTFTEAVIPIGIITSFIGAPVFLYLLLSYRKKSFL